MLVTDINDVKEAVEKEKFISLDTETNGLFFKMDDVVGISIACLSSGQVFYLPYGHKNYSKNLSKDDILMFLSLVAKKHLVYHNAVFDISMIKHTFGVTLPMFADTMLYAAVQGEQRKGLKPLTKLILEQDSLELNDVFRSCFGARFKGYTFADLDPEDPIVTQYAEDDALNTIKLFKYYITIMRSKPPIVLRVEEALIKVMIDLNCEGVLINPDVLVEQTKLLKIVTNDLEWEIYDLVDREFKINSSKELTKVLFGRQHIKDSDFYENKDPESLNLPVVKKTETGNPSFDKEARDELRSIHPIVQKIEDYKSYSKLLSGYLEKLPNTLIDGKVYCSYNSTGAVSGRITSSSMKTHDVNFIMGLNLQNIPKVKECQGNKVDIRSSFICKEDQVFVKADYSQIEYRLIANLSGEESFIESFKSGVDYHSLAASLMFKIPVDQVTDELRAKGKIFNFGLSYGMSSYTLSKMIKSSEEDAAVMIREFFNKTPKVVRTIKYIQEYAKNNSQSKTYFGRLAKLRLNSKSVKRNPREYASELRKAYNILIQGTAADFLKISMVRVHHLINTPEYKGKAQLVMTVHDELDFTVDKSILDKFLVDLKIAMEIPVPDDWCPLKVDISYGKSWSSLDQKEVEVKAELEKHFNWRSVLDDYVGRRVLSSIERLTS